MLGKGRVVTIADLRPCYLEYFIPTLRNETQDCKCDESATRDCRTPNMAPTGPKTS